jgi:hypothetical protein
MAATASDLSAIRAAALADDRVAMLVLADLAEAEMDDVRADAWRWLADPPAQGWEGRTWEVLRAASPRFATRTWAGGAGVWHTPVCLHVIVADDRPYLRWWPKTGRWSRRTGEGGAPWVTGVECPPDARDAVLSACRLALAG